MASDNVVSEEVQEQGSNARFSLALGLSVALIELVIFSYQIAQTYLSLMDHDKYWFSTIFLMSWRCLGITVVAGVVSFWTSLIVSNRLKINYIPRPVLSACVSSVFIIVVNRWVIWPLVLSPLYGLLSEGDGARSGTALLLVFDFLNYFLGYVFVIFVFMLVFAKFAKFAKVGVPTVTCFSRRSSMLLLGVSYIAMFICFSGWALELSSRGMKLYLMMFISSVCLASASAIVSIKKPIFGWAHPKEPKQIALWLLPSGILATALLTGYCFLLKYSIPNANGPFPFVTPEEVQLEIITLGLLPFLSPCIFVLCGTGWRWQGRWRKP